MYVPLSLTSTPSSAVCNSGEEHTRRAFSDQTKIINPDGTDWLDAVAILHLEDCLPLWIDNCRKYTRQVLGDSPSPWQNICRAEHGVSAS